MDLAGKMMSTKAANWVGLAAKRADNPFYQMLTAVTTRRNARRKWYQRAAPLIIGTLPALIWIAVTIHDYLTWYSISAFEDVFKYSPLIVIGVSYIIWASIELNQAILDAMSLLRRSVKQASRYELDDLTCVTAISNQDIVAGFLSHVLPPLFLRIAAGTGFAWVVLILLTTEWFSSLTQDTFILIAVSPISLGLWTLSGCLGATALIAFFLALGSGRSTIPASMGSLVVLGSQGIWLIFHAFIWSALTDSVFGGSSNLIEEIASKSSAFLAPLVFVGLVAWGLHIASKHPNFKPIQAFCSPLMMPLLAMLVAIQIAVYLEPSEPEALGVCLVSYLWHFGDMLPLNFAVLLNSLFITGDLMGSADGSMNLWYRPITIILAQLALVYICLGHAVTAVSQRRQAS